MQEPNSHCPFVISETVRLYMQQIYAIQTYKGHYFVLKVESFSKFMEKSEKLTEKSERFTVPPCWLNAYSTMKKSSKEEKALVRCRPKFAQRLRKWITKGNPESTERGLESGIQSVPFKIHDCLNYHKWTMAATDPWEEPGRSASAHPSYPTQPQHVPLDV